MRELIKAMEQAFDQRERYRELLRKSREQHKVTREADARVYELRRIMRAKQRRAA